MITILFILDLDEINEKFEILANAVTLAKFLKASKVARKTSEKNEIKKRIGFASSVSKDTKVSSSLKKMKASLFIVFA